MMPARLRTLGRRSALLLAAAFAWRITRSAPATDAARQPDLLIDNGPYLRLQAGGPTGLLAIAGSGALDALDPVSGAARRLTGDIDPLTPLATGHGRIAARTKQGALRVWEAGHVSDSKAGALAPAAGLLNLPHGVAGICRDGTTHHVVRLEPVAGAWGEAARSSVDVLPDARLVQVDLDGQGDGGHLAVLGGPDGQRYRHGVLGDEIEATRLLWLDRHGLGVLREHVLPAPYVFEDIAPRAVRFEDRAGLLTVRSGPGGAQLALFASDPRRSTQLELVAVGDDLGKPNRWMAPTTDGKHILAVHTPHLGGVLHAYHLTGERLEHRRITDDVSTHAIGSRELDSAVWTGSRLVLPSQNGRRLRVLDAADDWRELTPIALPSRAVMTAALATAGGFAILMANGAVAIAHV